MEYAGINVYDEKKNRNKYLKKIYLIVLYNKIHVFRRKIKTNTISFSLH